jgi:hypothetical protein
LGSGLDALLRCGGPSTTPGPNELSNLRLVLLLFLQNIWCAMLTIKGMSIPRDAVAMAQQWNLCEQRDLTKPGHLVFVHAIIAMYSGRRC